MIEKDSWLPRSKYREVEYTSHRQSLEIEIARVGNSKFETRFGGSPIDERFKFPKEHGINERDERVDLGKTKMRDEVIEIRKEAQLLNVTIVTKDKMTDQIKLDLTDLNEAHESRLWQEIRDHQDTISSPNEAVEKQ